MFEHTCVVRFGLAKLSLCLLFLDLRLGEYGLYYNGATTLADETANLSESIEASVWRSIRSDAESFRLEHRQTLILPRSSGCCTYHLLLGFTLRARTPTLAGLVS